VKKQKVVPSVVALLLLMLAINYVRGREAGESLGLAVLASALVVAIIVGLGSWLLYDHKRKGGQIHWEVPRDRPPGEGRQPSGWWWDGRLRRWRRPPRPDA
jgi:hypothetical protein